jgi:hypothetical protein
VRGDRDALSPRDAADGPGALSAREQIALSRGARGAWLSFANCFSERWSLRMPSEKTTGIMVSMPAIPSQLLAKLLRPGVMSREVSA